MKVRKALLFTGSTEAVKRAWKIKYRFRINLQVWSLPWPGHKLKSEEPDFILQGL